MTRPAVGVAVVAALVLCACGADKATTTVAEPVTPSATVQKAAVERVTRKWIDDRDCSLISVSYAMRLGRGSVSEGRAECNSDAVDQASDPRRPSGQYTIESVTLHGDVAEVRVVRGRLKTTYALVRDGAGRWRIDDDAAQPQCSRAGRITAGSLEVCFQPNANDNGYFVVTDSRGQRGLLDVALPFQADTVVGHWEWAAASPDGKTLLAQWSAECEVPLAFFVPASGGKPQPVTGETAAAVVAPDSVALGWTTDGRAIVFLPSQPACGTGGGPGTYLIALDGTRTFVAPATGPDPPPGLKRSLHARSEAAVRLAATG